MTLAQLRRSQETGECLFGIDACIDSRSAFDARESQEIRLPSEASWFMLLHHVKAQLVTRTVRSLSWVDTNDMVADGLNKGVVSRKAILRLCAEGEWLVTHPAIKHSKPETNQTLEDQ